MIPTRNRVRLVSEAIESALNQRIGQVEVIVVDDGSTDDTASMLARSFASRIELVRLPTHRGAGAARNAGARLARAWVGGVSRRRRPLAARKARG